MANFKTYSNNYIDKLKNEIEYYEEILEGTHKFRLELEKKDMTSNLYLKTLEYENQYERCLDKLYDELDELMFNIC